jgi:microcystin-dependent protein
MASDTYTTDGVGVILMGTGNDNNIWGANLNSFALQIFADAIANTLINVVTGGTLDLSGSPPPAAPSQAHYAALTFTGTLASAQIVQVPNLTKWWWVNNQTSGAFTLTFKTPSGSASTPIPQNSGWQFVSCDGNNNIIVSPFNSQQIQMPDGSVSAPAYSDINETNSGWYRHGTQDWRLAINGADVLQATGTGAATASIFNVLSPNVVQQQGVQIVPPGAEMHYAGINAPSGWLFEYGQTVLRATYPALLAALRASFTGSVTNGSPTIASVTTDLRGLGLEGSALEGTGLSGLTIVSITATSIAMSGNANAGSGSPQTCLAYPYGNGDGTTTFGIPDRRDASLVARGNMGGAAKGNITSITTSDLNATGGAETVTISIAQLPVHTPSGLITINDPGHRHGLQFAQNAPSGGGTGSNFLSSGSSSNTLTATTGITATFAGNSIGGGNSVNKLMPLTVSNMIIKT